MVDEAEQRFYEKKKKYIKILEPVFFPPDPARNDIVLYFASLLRVSGIEDPGTDPYAESRALLDDLNGFFKLNLPIDAFPDPVRTEWRIGLLLYSHIVEMDAPFEVITNLLRYQLGNGYSPNPYYALLSEKEQKNLPEEDYLQVERSK